MRAIIFSGTTEGRELSHFLAARGARVTVCVATAYGEEEQGAAAHITVEAGRKTALQMEGLIQAHDICIDATHPYAVEVTKNILAACEAVSVPYRRLLRQQEELVDRNAVWVQSAAEAAEWLLQNEGNALLTIGAKELHCFAGIAPERLFPRVLPAQSSLAACEALHIPHRNILAMQGPFSAALNRALIEQFRISVLVTKEGGQAGGFAEKVEAAAATGTQLLVIRRPAQTGESYVQLVAALEEMMRCR